MHSGLCKEVFLIKSMHLLLSDWDFTKWTHCLQLFFLSCKTCSISLWIYFMLWSLHYRHYLGILEWLVWPQGPGLLWETRVFCAICVIIGLLFPDWGMWPYFYRAFVSLNYNAKLTPSNVFIV